MQVKMEATKNLKQVRPKGKVRYDKKLKAITSSDPPVQTAPILRPSGVPKSVHLSKKDTEKTNEPLWKDSFVIDGEETAQNSRSETFYFDLNGFVGLIRNHNHELSIVDLYLRAKVPESAFTYYNIILAWYRLSLLARRGLFTTSINSFLQSMPSMNPVVPHRVASYLARLRDFTDALGVYHEFTTPRFPRRGQFGRVDRNTHIYYESLPASYVAFQRVVTDLTDRDKYWDIANISPNVHVEVHLQKPQPKTLRPRARIRRKALSPLRERPANHPSANMVGWAPEQPLSKSQKLGLEHHISSDDEFVNPDFCYHRPLMLYVYRALKEVKGYEMAFVPSNEIGSAIQQFFFERETDPIKVLTPVSDASGVMCCASEQPVRLWNIVRM